MAVISARGLGKEYRLGAKMHNTLRDQIAAWIRGGAKKGAEHFWALKDVNFEVNEGEVLGVIGRNGAGKSTLLKILSQVTEPTEGEVRIRGRVASLLEVGTGFHPELSGRENIFLNGAILGMKRAEIRQKFDEIVAFADVDKFVDTPVKHYSSGMYVRLAFAVAAHLEAELLIIDEVLAVGDMRFQNKCLEKIGQVARSGRTGIYVSHSLATVESLCDRVIILSQGRIAYCGPSHEAIKIYTATALGGARALSDKGILRKVELATAAGQVGDRFQVGDEIVVTLHMVLPTEVADPMIGIGVNTASGHRVFTVGSFLSTDQLPRLHGEVAVKCIMRNPPLAPGDYTMKISIGRNHENFESIEDAASFSIDARDYFGNGKMPDARQGALLVRSNWAVV